MYEPQAQTNQKRVYWPVDKGRAVAGKSINNNAVITLTREELRIIVQALNEVCNGIDFADAEFTTRMGTERIKVQALLTYLVGVYDNLGPAESEKKV